MNLLRTAATPPAANRWKIVDRTDDDCDEYPELAYYEDNEADAYERYEKLLAEGNSVALYSCYDDGHDATPWELEEYEGDDLNHPGGNVACDSCGAKTRYLHPNGECTDCYPVARAA